MKLQVEFSALSSPHHSLRDVGKLTDLVSRYVEGRDFSLVDLNWVYLDLKVGEGSF